MGRAKALMMLVPFLGLAACASDFTVTGLLAERETLHGSMTRYNDGGTIELFGEGRLHCVGNFTLRNGRSPGGDGTLVCDDRRMGPFNFTSRGMNHGSGKGMLDGVAYTFSY